MEVNDVGREEKGFEGENGIMHSASTENEELGWGKVYSLVHYKHLL
jgi:hypothetical protein